MDRVEILRIEKADWEKRVKRLFPLLTLALGSILGTVTGIDDPLKAGTVVGFVISGVLLGLTLFFYIIFRWRVSSLTNSIKRSQ